MNLPENSTYMQRRTSQETIIENVNDVLKFALCLSISPALFNIKSKRLSLIDVIQRMNEWADIVRS